MVDSVPLLHKLTISEEPTITPEEDLSYDFPLPTGVLIKIFDILPVEWMLKCRLVCQEWNSVILQADLLDIKSCFVFDGRKEDSIESTKCAEYMDTSDTKNYMWSHLKLRRVVARHCTWLFRQIELDPDFTASVTTLELLNSTLNWAQILQLLIEFEHLTHFFDKQDIYCWDYATFNSGIEEDEVITETASFQLLRNQDKLDTLSRLGVVRIHRSQLIECTTYLKILQLRCQSLRELEINTDQNFAPQRGNLFYAHLEGLLMKSGGTLRTLRFPYKLVCPSYDFRTTDEHRLFREFLTYVIDHQWIQRVNLPVLETLTLQYGIVPMEGQDFVQKLAPFLQSLPNLTQFYCGCVHLENGEEGALLDFLSLITPRTKVHFGVFMNDAIGLPNISQLQSSIRSLSVQTFRDFAKELVEILPTLGTQLFPELTEFQYFSKNHTFRNFNLQALIYSFSHMTHLNLVDHNARLETRHSCEALATIEDPDMQLLIRKLPSLVSLQLIGNMTFLTDLGLTGLTAEACQRMLKSGDFLIQKEDRVGLPISHLQDLRSLVFRGLGIKVTDVSARLGFKKMPFLTKLHLYGCHQITGEARTALGQLYNAIRGCDLQL